MKQWFVKLRMSCLAFSMMWRTMDKGERCFCHKNDDYDELAKQTGHDYRLMRHASRINRSTGMSYDVVTSNLHHCVFHATMHQAHIDREGIFDAEEE